MYPPPRMTRRGLAGRFRAAAVRALVLALTATAAPLFAQPTLAQAATSRQTAVPSAPMGWASWNSFAAKIDYSVIRNRSTLFGSLDSLNIGLGWWF